MHELAVAQAIADTVLRHAAGRRPSRVQVQIGAFRQVVPASLEFSWQLLTEATDLDGCALAVDLVPAAIACRTCAAETTLTAPILLCGRCTGSDVELVRGEEFAVVSIDRGALDTAGREPR